MPLDPTIPLQAFTGRPAQVNTPSQTLENIGRADLMRATVEQTGLENQLLQQRVTAQNKEAAERAAIEQVFKDSDGDIEKAMPQIMRISPKLGFELQEAAAKEAKANFERVSAGLKRLDDQLTTGLRLASGIVDQASHAQLRPAIQRISTEVGDWLGDTYDPAKLEQLNEWGVALKALNDTRLDALKTFADGKPQQALAGWLSTARNQQEWDGALNSPEAFGVPRSQAQMLKDLFGPYSPEAVERAKALHAQSAPSSGGTPPSSQDVSLIVPGIGEVAGQFVPGRGGPGSFLIQDRDGRWVEAPVGTRKAPPPQAPLRDDAANNRLWVDRPQPDGSTAAVRVREDEVQPGDQPRDTRQQGRPVTSGDARLIADYKTGLGQLETLRATIGDGGSTGWMANIKANAPKWMVDITGIGTTEKQKRAVIDLVKQIIGKNLEGGVLRKEDELKYANILPTMGDPGAVVKSKLALLDKMIVAKRDDLISSLEDSGYDVEAHKKRLSTLAPAAARGKVPSSSVPPDVAAHKPTDPKKARRVRKREAGVLYEYVVYADGSADKTKVE